MNTGRKVPGMLEKTANRAVCVAMGIIISLQNIAFAAGDVFNQLKRMAAQDNNDDYALSLPEPAGAELRLSMKNYIPQHLQEQVVALCFLAKDIIAHPESAGQRFSENPKAYLAERGIMGVTLDLTSREVKVVLALGDKEVREAALKGDVRRYLQLLESKGLLGIDAMGAIKYTGEDEPPGHEIAAVPVLVYIVAGFATYVTVLYTAIATVNAAGAVAVYYKVAVTGDDDKKNNVMNGIEGKLTALLWGTEAAREMLENHISEKSDEWADIIAELPSAKQHNLSRETIKIALKKQMIEGISH